MFVCEFNECCHTSFAHLYVFVSLGHQTKYFHLTILVQPMAEKSILNLLWHTNETPISKLIQVKDMSLLNLIWAIC